MLDNIKIIKNKTKMNEIDEEKMIINARLKLDKSG